MPFLNKKQPPKWRLYKRYSGFRAIISVLDELPDSWCLTSLREKRSYRNNWQHEAPIERSHIKELLEYGEPATSKRTGKPYTAYISGIGLRTGTVSGGLLAIDIDGESARPLLEEMGKSLCLDDIEDLVPKTVEWTSGKPGRSQLLFKIPFEVEFTRKVVTEFNELHTASGDLLEFRYNGCQSALPPSYHPETGSYQWLNSPTDCEVAVAPVWLQNLILSFANQEREQQEEKEQKKREREERRRARALNQLTGSVTLEEVLQQSCDRLGIDAYDWSEHNFYEMRGRLEGCCPNHDSRSGRSFHVNKATLEWYCFGCAKGGHIADYRHFVATGNIKPRGKDFVAIVRELAESANVEVEGCFRKISISNRPLDFPKNNAPEDQERCSLSKSDLRKEKNRFKRWIAAIGAGLGKAAYKGFGQFAIENLADETNTIKSIYYRSDAPIDWQYCAQNNIKIIYSQGQRAEVFAKAEAQFVLDTSPTGTGKSHDSGLFTSETGKVWLLEQNHRNPTTESVEENKTDIPTRNLGLVEDETRKTALGNPFLHNVGKDEKPDIPPNCHQAHLFHIANNKGYNPDEMHDGKTNSICANCIFERWKIEDENGNKISKCAGSTGHGHGYRFLKRMALSHLELRGHIDSLPSIENHDYSQDIAIVDEAQTHIRGIKKITATITDLDKILVELATRNKEAFDLILPYLTKLRAVLDRSYRFEGLERKHGLDHEKVLKILGEPPENLAEVIDSLEELTPDIESLIEKPDKIIAPTKDLEAWAKTTNSEFRRQALQRTEENFRSLAANILLPLLQIWLGTTFGTIRITPYHSLKITLLDRTHGEKLSEFKKAILLDATGDKAQIAQILGVEPTQILTIKQTTPKLENLKIINVNMAGLGSGKWSTDAQKRADALINALSKEHTNLEVLTLKQYANIGSRLSALGSRRKNTSDGVVQTDNENSDNLEPRAYSPRRGLQQNNQLVESQNLNQKSPLPQPSSGYWFKDNRGTNRYKGVSAIAAFGKPYINLGDAQDEYQTLYGTLKGFKDYYKSLMEREIKQLIGRQRAHLYSDRHFFLYLVAPKLELDFLKPLGVQIASIDAWEITPEAGTVQQFRRSQLLEVVKQLVELGETISQKRVAQMMGITQSQISKIANAIAGGWRTIKIFLPLYIDSYKPRNIFDAPEIKNWILANLDGYLGEWLEMIATKGFKAFTASVLSHYSQETRGFILAILYSVVLSRDDLLSIRSLLEREDIPHHAPSAPT